MCDGSTLKYGKVPPPTYEEWMKARVLHIQKNQKSFSIKNYILGFYYLTFAKWFDPEKYRLAHKALGWLK